MQVTLLSNNHTPGELALNDSIPSLGLICSTFNANTIIQWIDIQLHDLIDYLEQQQGVTDQRISELAAIILSSYPHYNVAEIMLFLAYVKRGDYGQFYGVSGPNRISTMLHEYDQQRSIDIDRINQLRLEETKRNQHTVINQYTAYLRDLEQRAEQGDTEAQEILNRHRK